MKKLPDPVEPAPEKRSANKSVEDMVDKYGPVSRSRTGIRLRDSGTPLGIRLKDSGTPIGIKLRRPDK